MKKQLLINTSVVLIALSPLIYLLFAWNAIPLSYTTRFEFNEVVEKVQSRNSLLMATIILSVVCALLYVLMRNLQKVDPKVTTQTPASAFHRLGLAITLFLVVMNYFFIISAEKQLVVNSVVGIRVFGLFILIIGNYMNNLKPNFVAGIRLPWTLNDPENWRKTHQLAGKTWFAGGITLVVSSFILPVSLIIPVAIIVFTILVFVPMVYSYQLYRKRLNHDKS